MRFLNFLAGMVFGLAVPMALALAQPAEPSLEKALQTLPPPQQTPFLWTADEMRYHAELGVVVATGRVELFHDERILIADTVSYNQRDDLVTASGNVQLLEPSGDVMFADFMELTGNMKDGVIENIRVLLSDDARLAAGGGRRSGGNRTEFRKAVYSPCDLCPDEPDRPPIWQIKAIKVVHDQEAQQIEYYDATMELFGIPVAYFPYFAHPDPTVKRKSGFLTPSYGSDSELGLVIHAPYYFNIAPNRDATIEAILTGKEGLVLTGEYRHRLVEGEMTFSASATRGTTEGGEKKGRGHVRGRGRFNLDDTWRWGFDGARTTDDTYLRRYHFGSESTLTAHAFAEGFRARNYAAANAYLFQGLRAEDDPGQTPLILPILDYNFVGEPGRFGARWRFDANLLILTRDEGVDSRRLSLKTGWHLPFTSPAGEVYTFFASLQSDAYLVDGVTNPSDKDGPKLDGLAGRLFPQIGMDWRFPLIRSDRRYRQVLEPMAGIILAPNGGNPRKVPNEDSLDFELDDTNLFSPNRFTGLDRVEGGNRIHYGLRAAVMGPLGGSTSAFIGQSFRLSGDDTFAKGSGLEDHFSDIVGRVDMSPLKYMNLLYRFRIDQKDFKPKRNEIGLKAGIEAFKVAVNYVFVEPLDESGEFPGREEVVAALDSKLSRNWFANLRLRQDLSSGGGALSHGMRIQYEDECILVSADFTRSFTRDRDLKPTDTVSFRIVFRNLGEIKA